MFPFLIAFFAYASGAIALYFVATNLFMLVQDFFVKKRLKLVPPAPALGS
jgi:membrane protein insertase Oxa1/YidC/SpoIIIJ